MRYMEGGAYLMSNWTVRFFHWLARAQLATSTISVAVIAVWLPFSIQTEPAIRLAGLGLQLLGIVAAALGIRDTRRMFNKPSFLQLLRSWATSWPRFKPKVQYASGSATLTSSGYASATVWQSAPPYATLEQRIDALEANLKSVEGRLRSSESAISKNKRTFTSKLQQETQERGTQFTELHRKMEATSTDGLRLATAGVFWLAVGLVLSTASPELLALS
ncbi:MULTISPECIES: hypothetical protein [unclassified Modicisalibacter]|uniref:hypothetical protein n=1 Tax=unclassified Modicisalibacter TaxID=2679913 RepID=UPI001CCC2EC0|nr:MULTISPECIES: hypothetical protein [unclassified Modicisalibacter]MBZ9559086.1 hypothetical protein [Modicisalibacter sp. R2A 31.J]MBZ9576803.1 hypothetical protein [Modicisalibacter sp. MOD 31.J]